MPATSKEKSYKIALVLNDDFSMYHFRGDLIRHLVSQGHEVYLLVPFGNYFKKLEKLGASCIPIKVSRFFSPRADIEFLLQMQRICRREKFDIVHNMTIKPNIFGTIGAKLAGIKRIVCLVSGVGFAFTNHDSIKGHAVQFFASILYKVGFRLSQRTWFQNPDDFSRFVKLGLIPESKGIVIRSGGINTDEYRPDAVSKTAVSALRSELGIPKNHKTIVMIAARLIWSKGVAEFVDTARDFQGSHPEWHFVLLCPRDENSWESVPKDFLDKWDNPNFHLVDTFRSDIKTFLAMSDIVTLPSYYPEGVPRTLLEALAMAKPIVTTDRPGCREVVDDGKNGWLVPARDSIALSEKLKILAQDEQLRLMFGRESRTKAEQEFDSRDVVRRITQELYQI